MHTSRSPSAFPADPSAALQDRRRLAALHDAGLLDTLPEEVFDRLTALAAVVLGVPVSFISLVDSDRDFYKSQVGLPEPLASDRGTTGRTLCHYTLGSEAPLALDDVLSMPGYRDVPTVQRFGIRAYLGVPMRTGGGENIGSFCVMDAKPHAWSEYEISVLRELAASATREIRLRSALRAVAAADARKDVFLATMAHELRQPLAALMPAVRVMETTPSEHTMRRARDIVDRQVIQLQRVVDDLTDVAGVSGGKVTLKRQRSDVAKILGGAADSVAATAERRQQRLRVEGTSTPVWHDVDPDRFHQVFSNLITNATKYTDVGGEIVVALSDTDAAVVVSVRDTGRGISAEALPHIFDLFVQEGAEQGAGLGIGLHLVRGLVTLHGGTVEARSEGRDRGSEFIVTLPR